MTLTPNQLHILQHAHGLDQYGQGRDYRNHYCDRAGSPDYPDLLELVTAGLMINHGSISLSGGDSVFTVTSEGRKAIREQSPKPPKISRSRARYLQWLKEDCSHTFGEWLKLQKHRKESTI